MQMGMTESRPVLPGIQTVLGTCSKPSLGSILPQFLHSLMQTQDAYQTNIAQLITNAMQCHTLQVVEWVLTGLLCETRIL